MKVQTKSYPQKILHLAAGLAIGAAIIAFSATDSRAEDSFYGDTADQTDFNLKYGDNPYYGKTIVAHKHYRYKRYRYRRPHRVRYYGYRDPFFSPYYHSRLRSHYVRYHYPFADPFYGPRGYWGHGISIRLR